MGFKTTNKTKKRVKIFHQWTKTNWRDNSFEESINNWFDENPDIEIYDAKQSILEEDDYLIISIFYGVPDED